MKDCQCFAKAIDPERQKMWERIFREGKVPITCPIPVGRGNLAGLSADFYLVDFDRVSYAEKEALIFAMANKFNFAPKEIRKDIETQGAPIKADSLTISICQMHGLAMMPDVEFEEPTDEAEYPDDEEDDE